MTERPLNNEENRIHFDPDGITIESQSPDPADELMDFLGLPREEGKRALWEAARGSVPVDFWGEMIEPEGDK